MDIRVEQRQPSKFHLFLVASTLYIVATYLPGGLLPHTNHERSTSKDPTLRNLKTASNMSRDVFANLQVDSSGMLLHPQCDSSNSSISAKARTLLSVRCTSSGRIEISRGDGGRFGLHGLPITTVGQLSLQQRLFCGDAERAHVARRCLPMLIRAVKEEEPELYVKHVQTSWAYGAQKGLPLCCESSEEAKTFFDVNISRCGVPCGVKENSTVSSTV